MFGRIIGTKKGLIRIAPLSNKTLALASVVGNPPLPLPITTPKRVPSSLDKFNLEFSRAVAAAATAICANLATLLISFGLAYCPASKSSTSPAMSAGNSSVSHKVIFPIPALPPIKPDQ